METWMYWGLAGFFLFAAAVGLLVYRRYGGILLLLIAIPSGLLGLAALWFATGQ